MGITTGHSTTTATSEKHHVSATANVCPSAKLTDARTGVHIPTASQTRSAHVTARRITFLITTGHSTTTATSEKRHVSATANVCPSAKLTDARTGVHIPTASQTRSAHVTARRITFLITTG